MNTAGFKESVDNAETALKTYSAFTEGQRAASLGVIINPFVAGTPEHAEWFRGRQSVSQNREAA